MSKCFQSPIKSDGTGIYKQGRTLPVKFQLTDVNGQFISGSIARLFAAKINNNTAGTDEVALSSGNNDSGNVFRYDSQADQYIFNLDTGLLSAGTWQLKVVLDDDANHIITISIKP